MTKPVFEIPNEMRDFAEKSVDQARKAFDGYMDAAHQAANRMETAAQAAGESAKQATSKAVTFAGDNVTAAFELARKLLAARDVQEVLSIQSEFAKAQLAAIQAQAAELSKAMQAPTQTKSSKP